MMGNCVRVVELCGKLQKSDHGYVVSRDLQLGFILDCSDRGSKDDWDTLLDA